MELLPINNIPAGNYYVIIDMGLNSPFCTAQSETI